MAVPPVAVELAVTEAHDLSESVEEGLEKSEKASQPAEEGDGGELHETFDDGCEVQCSHTAERILKQRYSVLGAGDPDDDAESYHFNCTFRHK